MQVSIVDVDTRESTLSDASNWPQQRAELLQENARLSEACEKARSESITYSHIVHALACDCVDLFYINMETGDYIEYNTDNELGVLSESRRGSDFFESCEREAKIYVHPDDQVAFVNAMNKEFLTNVLNRSGVFEIAYRRIKDARQFYVRMKVSQMEDDNRFAVIAVSDIDEFVMMRRAEERMQEQRLEQARSKANIDALTGVKNKHAYLETEARIDRQIAARSVSPFAVVMLDVNDLKKVNDTDGHQAGDKHIRDACKTICEIFKHSSVFRVGGDEFSVIAQGEDYTRIEERLAEMKNHNAEALRFGGIIIACGMARFENDICVATVFDRADRNMYEDKNRLKHTEIA